MSLSTKLLSALRDREATGTQLALDLGAEPKNVSSVLYILHLKKLVHRRPVEDQPFGRRAYLYRRAS